MIEILKQHENLILLNGTDLCQGLITRSRVAGNNIEKSIIDFVILSDDLLPLVISIIIDEDRKYSLTRITKDESGKTCVIESDHNLITEFNIAAREKKVPQRIDMFNYRNVECQKIFKKVTTEKTNNKDINIMGKKFLKSLNEFSYLSFRKIRVSHNKKNTEIDNMLNRRRHLRNSVNKLMNFIKILKINWLINSLTKI